VASIGLTKNVEIVLVVLGMDFDELLNEVVKITGDLLFVVVLAVTISIRKPSTRRLINEENIRLLVPGLLVVNSRLTVLTHRARSILAKKCQHRRAAWSSCEPQDGRSVLRALPGLEEPIKVVLATLLLLLVEFVNVKVTVMLLHASVAESLTRSRRFFRRSCFAGLEEDTLPALALVRDPLVAWLGVLFLA